MGSFFRANKVMALAMLTGLVLIALLVREIKIYGQAKTILEATITWSQECIADDQATICMALRSTHRNLDEVVGQLAWPFSRNILGSEDYQRLKKDLWPKAEARLAYSDKEREKLDQNIADMRVVGQALQEAKQQQVAADADLERDYDALGNPKILFRCNGDLSLLTSKSALANYNAVLEEAQKSCADGRFEIVKNEK